MRTPLLALLLGLAACSNAMSPGSAKQAYERGLSALDRQDPSTARIEFLNAIKGDPVNPHYRLAQARAYLALANGEAAEAEIVQARRLGMPTSETRHLMAHAYSLQKRHRDALSEAEAAPPRHAASLARLRGRSLSALGEHDRAREEFAKALAVNSNDGMLWSDIARLQRSSGRRRAAIVAADRAVTLAPRSIPALLLRGDLAARHETVLDALYWFDRTLEVDPKNLEARLKRAETLRRMGDYQALLAETRKVLKLSENNPTAYYYQARIAAEAGDFALARKLYQMTDGRLDKQPRVMLLASAIDYHFGNTEHALKRLERLIAKRPKNSKARRLLAACYWRLGDSDATVRTLRPLLQRRRPDRFTLTLMARARAKQGDEVAAARYLERVARREGNKQESETPPGP